MPRKDNKSINRKIEGLQRRIDRFVARRAEILEYAKQSGSFHVKCQHWRDVHDLETKIETLSRQQRKLAIQRDGDPQGLLWDAVPQGEPVPSKRKKGGR